MKNVNRLVSLLLALSFLLAWAPAPVHAAMPGKIPQRISETVVNPLYPDLEAPEFPDKGPAYWTQSTWEGYYTDDIDEAVQLLREGLKNRQTSISVPLRVSTDADFFALMGEIWEEAMAHTGVPTEGDYMGKQWHSRSTGGDPYMVDGVWYYFPSWEVVYFTNGEQEAQVDAAVEELLSSLNLGGKSDYEKVAAVYQWMCANITYDYDSTGPLKHSAYAALINRTSVCQGYALLLYRLLLELDIDCRYISGIGNGGSHGWNIVELDGLYYNLDATWDASYYTALGEYNYFLRSNATFEDHARDAEYETEAFNAAYPMGAADYEPDESEPTVVDTGTCGDGVFWELTEDGTLTISGEGEMENYDPEADPSDRKETPWDKYRYRSQINKIVVENGVTNIGDYAFCYYGEDCSLSSVTMADSVKRIGEYAFRHCGNLTEVTMSENLIEICFGAFSGCSSLTEITIPLSVTSVESSAFDGCMSLQRNENGIIYVDGWVVDVDRDISSASLRSGTRGIADRAFYNCSKLAAITILDSVIVVGDLAFVGCSNLGAIEVAADNPNYSSLDGILCNKDQTELVCCPGGYVGAVDIPNSVTKICGSAFYGCGKVTEVTIPEGITDIGLRTFFGCSKLTKVTIPDSLTGIGDYAFEGCSSLAGITIPTGVTSIGYSAFSGCSSLTSINIPESVDNIGSWVFYNCSSLTSIDIPESVNSIGNRAFSGCSNLTSIEIPDSVNSIGDGAFSGCSSLTSINIPESVNSIGTSAFSGCSSLTSINIPESVDNIGDWVFYNCSSLTSINIPESVNSIGRSAFSGCTKLIQKDNGVHYVGRWVVDADTTVTTAAVRDNTVGIADSAFSRCTNLAEISIADSVYYIGDSAFYDCSSLGSITIPANVACIKNYAFFNCTSLTKVVFEGDAPIIGEFVPGDNMESYTTFMYVEADIYYPADNPTWTKEVRKSYCGDLTWIPYTPVHTHSYTSVVTDPTCTEEGYTTHTCACGDSYIDSYVDALGHTPGAAATCEEPQTCTVCGEELNPATGHTPGVAASCEEPQTCTVCGEELNPATGHTPGVAATCEEPQTCTVCGEELAAALGHSFGAWAETKVPTCTEKGRETRTCHCGHTENRTIESTGHHYENGLCTECGAEEPAYLLGDVNGDGKINISDAILAAAYFNERVDFTQAQLLAADVNGDGVVNISDAILIAAYFNERIDKFPIQ